MLETYLIILSPVFFLISFFSIQTGLIFVVLSMLLSPEIPITTIGLRPVLVRIEDLLIPILVMAWIARLAIRREYRLIAHSPLNRPIFFLLAISVVSSIWGTLHGLVNPLMGGFYILKTTEFFAIFFLVVNYVRTERSIAVFLFFALLTALIVGVYTLIQVPSVEIFSTHRITAPFEGAPEPATVGGYMAILLLTIFGLFLYEEKLLLKWFLALLGMIIFIPFLYTLNRTSYIALFAGLLFIAVIEKRKWLTFLIVALLLASPLLLPGAVKDRIAWTWIDAANPGRELGVDYSFQERIYAFKKMWNSWKHSPLIGWGVTSWALTDSQYARTLHEIGIVGFALWAWIFTRLFRVSKWLFHSLEGGMMKGLVLGYRASLVAILLHGFGTITFYIVRIMEPFWFVSGLVISLYLLRIQEESFVTTPS